MECATAILGVMEEPRKKALLDIADNEGFTALFIATINGNSPMLKLLTDNGAQVSLQDKELHTPVHWAVGTQVQRSGKLQKPVVKEYSDTSIS